MEDQETGEEKVTSLTEAMLVTDFTGNNKRLRVNAFLDDFSIKPTSNLMSLGSQGELQRVNVSVLNGRLKSFETVYNRELDFVKGDSLYNW